MKLQCPSSIGFSHHFYTHARLVSHIIYISNNHPNIQVIQYHLTIIQFQAYQRRCHERCFSCWRYQWLWNHDRQQALPMDMVPRFKLSIHVAAAGYGWGWGKPLFQSICIFLIISSMISNDWLVLTSWNMDGRGYLSYNAYSDSLFDLDEADPIAARGFAAGGVGEQKHRNTSNKKHLLLGRLPMLGHQEQASILCKEDKLGTGKNWTSKLLNLKISLIVYRHSR